MRGRGKRTTGASSTKSSARLHKGSKRSAARLREEGGTRAASHLYREAKARGRRQRPDSDCSTISAKRTPFSPETPSESELHSTEESAFAALEESDAESAFRGRYKRKAVLGKGTYGEVWEAISRWNNGFSVEKGMRVAIKKVTRIFENSIEAKRLLREAKILKALGLHECIVSLLDIIPPVPDDYVFRELCLVFECCDTDLKQIFRSEQKFASAHVEYIMYQIMLAVHYMHTGGIVHRDLKPANILINNDCTIKICDFGLARGISEVVLQSPSSRTEDSVVRDETRIPATTESSDDDTAEADSTSIVDGDTDTAERTEEKTVEFVEPSPSKKAFFKRKKMAPKRAVTKHVVTRWYRAPEVILLQLRAETLRAVDMWSVGCIFAELLQMQSRYCASPEDRSVMFPGRSCFPLSAKDPFSWKDRRDQLNIIFDVIGTPTKSQIAAIKEDRKLQQYLSSLARKPPIHFSRAFPSLPHASDKLLRYLKKHPKVEHAISLLQKLLRFDVSKRYTAEKCFDTPYFATIRERDLEMRMDPVTFYFEDESLDSEQIREMIVEEARSYNEPEVLERAKAQLGAI